MIQEYKFLSNLANNMKKMKVGDLAFFYHSNAKPSGIVGLMEVVKEGYPDHTAFDPNQKYYDPKSRKENPTWYMIDVKFIEKFSKMLSLADLKAINGLEEMHVLKKGSRLSIQPVSEAEFNIIMRTYGH